MVFKVQVSMFHLGLMLGILLALHSSTLDCLELPELIRESLGTSCLTVD